jgi:hypothetical protein
MTDQQTADEAKQYIALAEIGGPPEASDFPLLSAELGVTAVSSAKSQLPAQPFLEWQVIGGAIKTARPATKAAIEGATTSKPRPPLMQRPGRRQRQARPKGIRRACASPAHRGILRAPLEYNFCSQNVTPSFA